MVKFLFFIYTCLYYYISYKFFKSLNDDFDVNILLKNVYKHPSLFLLWFALSVIFVFLIEYLVNL
jgi:hypothetical protein